ncbi:MAG: radical SAM/SPASM domain-containing protein [Gallionellaceae bacterium]|nr:radical SAM/SPASM domain-containing protein [Gallionellaceae bacterium]
MSTVSDSHSHDMQRKPIEEYGFYGRLSSDFPSQVIIDVTEVCNLACVHCPHPEFKKSDYYDTRYLDPELNKKIVDEIKELGQNKTQYIRYSSEGEPLIHPKGYEMIEYATRNSGVFVTLTTNGTIMNEKRTRRLLDAGVHMIDISIDAYTPETYAKIRVNGDLNVTKKNVLNLLAWIKQTGASTKVVVSFIEQPQNSCEVDAFESFWKEQGVDSVVVRRLHSAAGAVVNVAQIMRAEQAREVRRPCVYPWERIVLNPRGFLAFCPADWTHGSSIGDFRTTTIAQVWSSDFYQSLRDAHIRNDYKAHVFCGQCPDWKQTRWPNEGRGYADLIGELQQ